MMDTIWTNGIVDFFQGDCREVLAGLPAKSVHCVVTSPPYWGLRDYKVESTIWFPEGLINDCGHEWANGPTKHIGRNDTGRQFFPGHTGNYQDGGPIANDIISGAFCDMCGAWLGNLGLEPTPELYVQHIVDVFREVWRVLRDDGTLWLNLGDSYVGYKGPNYGVNPEASNLQKKSAIHTAHDIGTPQTSGLKSKDLVGIPWRVAFALQADGWYLRSDIIWQKPNPMPESVTDRPTKSHEYLFLLTKNEKYFYDIDAIKEPVAPSTIARGPVDFGGAKGREYQPEPSDPNYRNGKEQWGRTFDYRESSANGRNKRSVWTIPTQPHKGAHFATFPEKLVEPCILAGSPKDGTVLDPFIGSGTTALVAQRLGRRSIGIDASETYLKDIAVKRITSVSLPMRID